LEQPKAAIMGEQGMVRLEYLGEYSGRWRGAATCLWYEFPSGRRTQWVDKRDAEHLLAQRGPVGEELFRRA